jgi:hypothetical protein
MLAFPQCALTNCTNRFALALQDNDMAEPAIAEELIDAFDLHSDPYPDLPIIAPGALQDGDVLMMLGRGWVPVAKRIRLPVSWLIRVLDGGAYSHCAIVTIVDGEPRVWDHSDEWALSPVSLEKGIREHRWCHVYRLSKHGEHVGSRRYPAAPIVGVLNAHRGDPYDKRLLLMAGIVAVVSRMPESPVLREAVRRGLDAAVVAINWLLDHKDIRAEMLICTAVTGTAYWQAVNDVPRDYALEADIQRRGRPGGDAAWERTIAKLEEALGRVWPDLPAELEHYQRTLAGNAHWVEIGSPLLPVNLVSPSDLEFSRTLERVGRLEIPR